MVRRTATERCGASQPEEGLGGDGLVIFTRFQRTSDAAKHLAGTGIGVAGVLQVVEQHGEWSAGESHEGAGGAFTIDLPLTPPGGGT